VFRNGRIGLEQRKEATINQKFVRQDGIAPHNVKAACEFQRWVETSLTGDQQDYHVLRQVLKSIRNFDEQVTTKDLQETYHCIMEQDAYHNEQ